MKPTLGTILGGTALAISLIGSGGVAEAAKLINGKVIKPGTVTTKQIKDGTIAPADLAADAKVAGPAGPPGAAGTAVASGHVAGGPGQMNVDRARGAGGIILTRPTTGAVCIVVPGVSSATHVAVVTLDAGDPHTNANDIVLVSTQLEWCPANSFQVMTATAQLAATDAGFTFVIN